MEGKLEYLSNEITSFEEFYRIQAVQRELMFLKIFMGCYENWSNFFVDDSPSATKAIEAVDSLYGLFKDLSEMEKLSGRELVLPIPDMFLEKLEHIKPVIKESFLDFSYDLSLEYCKYSSKDNLKKLIHIAVKNLKDLPILKPDMIQPIKKQIRAVGKRLEFVSAVFHFDSRDHQWNSFFNHVKDWANTAAGVAFLYWVDEKDERLDTIVSRLIEKFKPFTLELAELYIGVLMALKPSKGLDFSLKRTAVARFLEILLEDLVVVLPTDDSSFVTIQHGLAFLISFLINPPMESSNFCVNEAASLICSLYCSNLKDDITKGRNVLLRDLTEKMNQTNAKIKELYLNIATSSWNNFPRTNVQGFMEFFLQDLQKKFLMYETTLTTYQRNQIMIVQKELLFIEPLLKGIFELEDENEKLKYLRMRISNMAYCAECIIDSCFCFDTANYWHNVMRLSDVTKEIQFITAEVNKLEHAQMCNTRVLGDDKMNSATILPPQANNTGMDDVHMVGFVDEKEKIINCLVGGLPQQRNIVAIVGMPGQGKTTLANKIYHDCRVRLHFKKHAWCCISQSYNIRDILFGILKQVDPKSCEDDIISNRSHEDLAEMLYRCLKGRTYLIVLDDIWDIGAWKKLKASFPDDENGSRIIFTSRIHKVALEAKLDCSLHELHPLSPEDSLELLQHILSYKDGIPLNLLGTGKRIAENCKGLPLAIVVIASLLAKAKNDLNFWKQIAESTNSRVAKEGCMNILELSYKHLPAYLRPCFLYLAVFKEDETIVTKRLMRYWIAEGFILEHENKSLEDVANEYLMDLYDRSLLFIAKRSSRFGGIKKCFVHDLMREFCLAKAKEENFLVVPNISDNHSIIDTVYQSYRQCFRKECWSSFESEPTMPIIVRTLLFSESTIKIPNGDSFFIRFELLRVLDLTAIRIDFDIDSIMQLVHLRYLSLVGGFQVPSSIVNLSRLEFLNLKTCDYVPACIWNMTSLRHLYIYTEKMCTIDDVVDEYLQLDKLETFSLLCLFCFEEVLEWLIRRLPNIRKLRVQLFFSIELLSFPNKLESLCLHCDCEKLFAAEFNLPFTLMKLTMHHSTLSAGILSAIGKLNLKEKDGTWKMKNS